MKSDIEIAQGATLKPIVALARERLGIPEEQLEPYGRFKAKLSAACLAGLADRPDGKLILVSGISPTPAGEGKTTTSVGLVDGLNRIGKNAIVCLREPSLGPVFGMKGGAAGGGYSQVVPMEDINLHFTGDFNAIALAHNLLAALVDNHVHHGNALGLDVRRITWKRVMDMNDRALRQITVGLGGPGNGYPREDGFDIVVASEIMAILCLAENLADLKARIGRIVVGYTRDHQPVVASQLQAAGAMTALLRDAIKPNLVQTLENNPAILHGGPFANIAHGCNSVIATRTALKLADYVVTEAGFGADLGAEKFIDIKCRKSGLRPNMLVLVASIRALKFHGGVDAKELSSENVPALERGIANLLKHLYNVRNHYGLPCVVALNHFSRDTTAEWELLSNTLAQRDVPVVLARHWSDGGAGAEELARTVVRTIEGTPSSMSFVYPDEASLWDKCEAVATKIYGAAGIDADAKVRAQLDDLEARGYGRLPICIAKTQYSFSTDPTLRGAPSGHVIHIREVRLAAGAEFVVLVCGDIMTMPGLPAVPSSAAIDVDADGRIVGLFKCCPVLPATLETERLLLRAPLPADAAIVFGAYAQDARVARFMMWQPHTSVATTEAFIGQSIVDFAAGTRLPYMLARLDRPDRPIGMLEARPAGHKVDFGYVLERACWGLGLMPEAVTALAQATLAIPGYFRVQAFCDVENIASQRTLEKSGFLREGRHERFVVHPNLDPEPRPCFVYARCR